MVRAIISYVLVLVSKQASAHKLSTILFWALIPYNGEACLKELALGVDLIERRFRVNS